MPTPTAIDLRGEWENSTPADPGTPAGALRALRRRDGVSREALARACGTDAAQIAAMEDGTAMISPEVATTLARVFRTVPSVFA